MLSQHWITCIVRSHSQVSGITINNRTQIRRVTVNCAINTVSNSKLIGCHTERHIFALFNGTYFVDSRHKNMAVDTGANLEYFDVRIDVNIAVFAIDNVHFTGGSDLVLYFLSIFNCNALIKVV